MTTKSMLTSNMHDQGFSVKIFIPSGDPTAIRIIEKSNRTAKGVYFPRALFGEVRRRPELNQPGVYVLVEFGEHDSPQSIYVGEGDPVTLRLEDHNRRRPSWTHAIVFVSNGSNLNKAHVQYLEARLVELANKSKRCKIENGNVPQQPNLAEADACDAEAFLADILVCLPILGLRMFEIPNTDLSQNNQHTIYTLEAGGVKANGIYTSQGHIVLKDSQMTLEHQKHLPAGRVNLRTQLMQDGVVIKEVACYRFLQDYTFSSPSSAATIILGSQQNGLRVWKGPDGRSLGETMS